MIDKLRLHPCSGSLYCRALSSCSLTEGFFSIPIERLMLPSERFLSALRVNLLFKVSMAVRILSRRYVSYFFLHQALVYALLRRSRNCRRVQLGFLFSYDTLLIPSLTALLYSCTPALYSFDLILFRVALAIFLSVPAGSYHDRTPLNQASLHSAA